MIVKNVTRKIVISGDVYEASSFTEKTLGLLDSIKPRSMLFKTHLGIHTFGMKKAIDVLIINEKNTVVAMREGLQPNRIFFWNPKHSFVLELPNGTLSDTKTQLGDIILFER